MTTSDLGNKALESRNRRGVLQPRLATLFLLGIVVLSGVIVTAWFAGVGAIEKIFAQIQFLQENPPMWLEVPRVMGEYLLAPTVALFFGCDRNHESFPPTPNLVTSVGGWDFIRFDASLRPVAIAFYPQSH
jgi:hypothetical protein